MTLKQDTFFAALLDPAQDMPTGLQDGAGRPAGRRFSVYRNNVAVSLIEALETGFPALAKLLGEANFKSVMGVFLRAHPPQSPLMMHYGAALPTFLADFEPLQKMTYLPDIARLELAIRQSYHAADSTPIDPQTLAQIPEKSLTTARLTLAPSLRLIQSHWPIHAIRAYALGQGPKPQANAQSVLILRPDYDPVPHLVDTETAMLIAALRDGQPLGQAQDAVPKADLGQALALLLGGNGITSIKGDTP